MTHWNSIDKVGDNSLILKELQLCLAGYPEADLHRQACLFAHGQGLFQQQVHNLSHTSEEQPYDIIFF